MESLPERLAKAKPTEVEGTWQRHVAAKYADTGLDGRSAQGRWGVEDSYPVLYLGKPTDSVIVEAYRHLIDPVDGPPPPIRPRVLVTCEVSVSEILDLRSAANRVLAGLTMQQLQSETYDRDAYTACQNVSAAAHQLGYRGLVAPAATRLGETLVLFTDRLPQQEKPVRTHDEMWVELPSDPRKPRRGNHLQVVR
ncbi:MAG: RES family NAD+ phosphorylase [Mycobacterium sp.]|nr:RES family NAD+ phosphorylase [Mycobacterium sp.]MBV8349136.1 RES family NAD+ phosphorylase [Mycolicibacterium sp.]